MKYDITAFKSPDLGLLLMRLMVATVGVYHGAQKLMGLFGGGGLRATMSEFEQMGIPLPMVSVLAIGATEFFGGIFIGLGLFMRIACIAYAFGMYVAVFKVHSHAFGHQFGGMEFPLTLAVILTGLFFTGPGRHSFSGR